MQLRGCLDVATESVLERREMSMIVNMRGRTAQCAVGRELNVSAQTANSGLRYRNQLALMRVMRALESEMRSASAPSKARAKCSWQLSGSDSSAARSNSASVESVLVSTLP